MSLVRPPLKTAESRADGVLNVRSGVPQGGLWSRRARVVLASTLFLTSASLSSCERAGDDALLIGRLYGDASVGCVWIGRPRGGLEIDWPPFVRVRLSPLRVTGPGFSAVEGEWFRMGGGTRPTVPVTSGCPVPEPEAGKFVAASVEYFGDERPSEGLGSTESP
jgi:hypothetical protein